MPTEDRYGQQLQEYFETQATTEQPKAVTDALKVVGCSRARAYQWLQTGARDVIEVDRNSRGAALFAYVPGTRGRLTVGRRGGGVDLTVGATRGMLQAMTAGGGDAWLNVQPGDQLTVVSVRRTVDGGDVEIETADGVHLMVTIR